MPSGDRAMARNVIAALEAGGAEVVLASDLRLYEGRGDAVAQEGLCAKAKTEVERVIAGLRDAVPEVWVTYHNYYKSPDLIGPAVSSALGIPYVQIETSRARRRLQGQWARFAQAAEAAADRADVIFYMTEHDRGTLERDRAGSQRLVHLPPFLPREDLPASARPGESRTILAAGMMRARAKRESYQLIADALVQLEDEDWVLEIAGDGPAREEVEAMMQPIAARTRFLGQLDPESMAAAYARAGLFLWPGVDEAYGMVYLEAQAAGLPVVAQDRPGVRDVLGPRMTSPSPDQGAEGLAEAIRHLLANPEERETVGAAGRAYVSENHLLSSAAARFSEVLASLKGGAA